MVQCEEIPMDHLQNHSLVKIVLVVHDIEKKVDSFVALFGIARPQVVSPSPPAPDSKAVTEFHGKRISGLVRLANIAMGSVTLELIEPMDGNSPWAEHLEKRGEGIFSIVCTVDGFEKQISMMNELGMPLYHLGEYGSGRYAYFETLAALGTTLCLQNLEKRF
jgi:methylmalonyl-CoA/ethylmalonyl-CoA epimerase